MLKQLLQLLLNTRTTPEEAAHNAMPSNVFTRLVDNGTIGSDWTNQAFSGIAAYDGYLYFAGTSTSAVPIIVISTAGVASNLTFPWEGARLATAIPIAKGQTWTVQGSSLKDVIIDLTKTVSLGGGYNRIIWRALSCLRALSNYLPKVFLRAKNSGLAVKHSLKQLLHWMFRHVPSLHRLMGILDTSTLSAVEANSCSIWIRVKKYLAVKSLVIAGFLQQTPTARQQYLSRKAVLLLLLPTRCSVKFGLPRLQARHNLRTGGALC